MSARAIGWDEVLGKNRYRAHYAPDAYSEIMTPVFEALAPSGQLSAPYARARSAVLARPELRAMLERAAWDAPVAEVPLLVTEEEALLSLEPVWRGFARCVRDYLRALYAGTPEVLPELDLARVRASRFFIRELEGKVPATERFEVFIPVQVSRTQNDKGRLEWTVYGLAAEDDEACFLKSLAYAPVGRALSECVTPEAEREPGFVEARTPDLAAFLAHVRHIHDAPRESPVLFVGSAEREAVYRGLGVGTLPATGFAPGDAIVGKGAPVVTFLPWERLGAGIRAAYTRGDVTIYPFVGTYLFRGFNEYEVLRVLRTFHPRRRIARAANGDAPVGDDFTNFLRVRVPRIARLDSQDAPEGAQKDEFKNLFSEAKGYLGLYDKPLVRMSEIVRDADGFPVLEGPLATPEQVRNVRLKVKKALASYSVVTDFVPKMQLDRAEVHWIRPIAGGDERRPLLFAGHGRARPIPAKKSYGAPDGTKAFDLAPAFLARASRVDLWALEERRTVSLVEAKKLEALAELDGALHRGLGIPAGASARTVLDALAGKRFACDFEALAAFVRERLAREPRATTLLARLDRAHDRYRAARSPEAPASVYDGVDQAEYRRLYEEYDGIVAGERDAVFFDGSGKKTRFKRKNNAQRSNQLGELVDWLESYYRELGYASEAIERHRFKWDGRQHENLIVTIRGAERPDEWVFLGDHIDTAFEADVFDASKRRVSAAGADDNASAVAAVMLAGRVLKDARPRRSIRLVHLTGEEFPADCLGTRRLCSKLVEAEASVAGVYIMDMIGFDRSDGLFQVSPGRGERSLACALDVLASAALWNRGGHGLVVRPDLRLPSSVDSSLYNTDGQIYSDAGFPVVLFMEDYDLSRQGYHDTHDTQTLLSWPYACAVAQIATDAAWRTANR